MAKYRKKPIVIAAVRYDGSFDLQFLRDGEVVRSAGDGSGAMEILTPREVMRVALGDWIMRTTNGRLYPCRPDTFEAAYEPVEQPTPTTGGDGA